MIEITLPGVVLIPLGLVAFFFRPRALPYLMLFAVPFSGVSVVNVRGAVSLLPWAYFALLWISRRVPVFIIGRRMAIQPPLRLPVYLMITFLVVGGLSLLMPAIIAGRVSFSGLALLDADQRFIRLSVWHFIHYGDLVLGILVGWLIASHSARSDGLRWLIVAYVAGGLATSVLGFGEWLVYRLGQPWPLYALNTAVSASLHGGARVLDDLGVMRISAGAEEPSALGQHLSAILPFVVFSIALRSPIISRKVDLLGAAAILAVLAASASTTAVAGILVSAVVVVAALVKMRAVRIRHVGAALALVAVATLGVSSSPTALEFLDRFVLGKLRTGSGLERIDSVVAGWGLFVSFPVLGVGWGVVPVRDLVVKLLVGFGFGGAMFFLAAPALILVRAWRRLNFRLILRDLDAAVALGASFASLVVIVVLSEVSGFLHQMGSYWVAVGFAMGSLIRAHTVMSPPASNLALHKVIRSRE